MAVTVAGRGFESPKAAYRIGNRETTTHRRSRKSSHFIQFVLLLYFPSIINPFPGKLREGVASSRRNDQFALEGSL